MTDGQIQIDTKDDGWRLIEGDKAAKDVTHCWLANENKTMAWESFDGVGFQPLTDTKPVWWRINPRG